MSENPKPVVVFTAQGPVEEDHIRGFLEAHGIPTAVRGEALRRTHAIAVDGLGAVEIEVPAELAGRARALLAQAEAGELELNEDWNDAEPE